MKTPSLLLLSTAFLSAAALAFCAPGRDADKGPHATPELKVDSKPLNRSAGAVTSYADVVEPVQDAVVSVYSSKIIRQQVAIDPFLRDFFFGGRNPQPREEKVEGLGSGVLVTADGYILTNNHVVEGADKINVSLNDGREVEATVIGTDPKTDVAVIKIDAGRLPFVTIGDSDRIRVGDVVFAVGNPLGIGQTVTMGIVSATGRNNLGILADAGGYENFIQTDAAINQGNSGGALIDAQGRLLGINTAIISSS
ncbi:MAG: trypsin-like peptidase domain-containing protein, partial [Verrucomicrobiota bacterium]